MSHEEIGQMLAEARRRGEKLKGYPGDRPVDLQAGFAVQDAMIRAMGVPVVGWKVGLTSKKAQKICGVNAPLSGPMFEGDVLASGVSMPLVDGDLGVLEAEIGFRMAADLPARAAPYEREEVRAALGTVHPIVRVGQQTVARRVDGKCGMDFG